MKKRLIAAAVCVAVLLLLGWGGPYVAQEGERYDLYFREADLSAASGGAAPAGGAGETGGGGGAGPPARGGGRGTWPPPPAATPCGRSSCTWRRGRSGTPGSWRSAW